MTESESITCPKCGMTSWNPNDVTEGYCGNCHEFTRTVSWPPVSAAFLPHSLVGPNEPGGGMGAGMGGTIDLGLHEHEWVYVDDEYGSLADGGSYEVYKCSVCNKVKYVQLPD